MNPSSQRIIDQTAAQCFAIPRLKLGYDQMKAALAECRLLFLAAVVLMFVSPAAVATGNFVTITLPRDVWIDLPKNWVVLSSNQRITLDTAVQSTLDLSRIVQPTSELPFAAHYYDDQGHVAALLNIRYYPGLDVSQQDARYATVNDIAQLDATLHEQLDRELNSIGMSMMTWHGTSRKDINGITTFITEYSRTSIRGPGNFRVRLVRVFDVDRSFTLTISYLDAGAIVLRPIADRIINSLRLVPPAR